MSEEKDNRSDEGHQALVAALNEWKERPLEDKNDLRPDHIASLGPIHTDVMMSLVGFGDAQNALEVGR